MFYLRGLLTDILYNELGHTALKSVVGFLFYISM